MRAQGIPMNAELLAAVRQRDALDEPDIEIWPDMAAGVLTFFAMTTQWKRGPMGELTGLDYAAIEPTAKMLGVSLNERAFHDIRELEGETLQFIRSKRRG